MYYVSVSNVTVSLHNNDKNILNQNTINKLWLLGVAGPYRGLL